MKLLTIGIYKKMKYTFFIILLFLAGCSSKKEYIPEEFFGLKRIQFMTGDEAKKFIDRLHLQEVAPLNNEIGFYEGEDGSAIIYVTYYANNDIALEEEIKMTDKISPENSVFIEGSYFTEMNKNIYRCFGMGQTHFVFSQQNMLFWLSVETHWGQDFLKEYLTYIGN